MWISHLVGFIEDKKAILPIDTAIQSNLRETTTRVLASLTPREERVLRMRFGIGMNTDHILEEVGLQFSVTRERLLPDVRPVRYHDGFQAGRFTKFCHRYNWIVRVQDGFEIDRKFSRYHEHGNDADYQTAYSQLGCYSRNAACHVSGASGASGSHGTNPHRPMHPGTLGPNHRPASDDDVSIAGERETG